MAKRGAPRVRGMTKGTMCSRDRKRAVVIKSTLLLSLVILALQAQAPHSVTLTWDDTLNPPGTTYNIYRAVGLCSGTPAFSRIATAVSTKTCLDICTKDKS